MQLERPVTSDNLAVRIYRNGVEQAPTPDGAPEYNVEVYGPQLFARQGREWDDR